MIRCFTLMNARATMAALLAVLIAPAFGADPESRPDPRAALGADTPRILVLTRDALAKAAAQEGGAARIRAVLSRVAQSARADAIPEPGQFTCVSGRALGNTALSDHLAGSSAALSFIGAEPTRFAAVDSRRVADWSLERGIAPAEVAERVMALILPACRAGVVDIVFHQAAYADPRVDITPEVLAAMEGAGDLHARIRARGLPLGRLGTLDDARLDAWAQKQLGYRLDARAFAAQLAERTAAIAREHGVTLVLQGALYAHPNTDLTPALTAPAALPP